jgi:hypothetical protein
MPPNLLQQQSPQQGFSAPGFGNTSGPSIGQVGSSILGSIGTPRPLNQTAQVPVTPQSGINFGAINFPTGGIGAKPPVTPTPTGGQTFDKSIASGLRNQNTSQPDNSLVNKNVNWQNNVGGAQGTPVNQNNGLGSLITTNHPTQNGGSVTLDGSGNVSGSTSAPGYSIDTSGAHTSDALTGNNTASSLNQSYQQYQDLLNGVSQAQLGVGQASQYSPAYLQAYQQQQQAQGQGAALGYNQAQYGFTGAGLGVGAAQINSNLYTGNNLPGDTMAYAQGATARAQAQNTLQQATNTYGQAGNTLQQAQNSIQQLAANQNLNTQQLARTGNIAAAQSGVSAAQTQLQSPAALAAINSIDSVNKLGDQYPGAGILPTDSIEQARQKAAASPAYQAGFQSTYSTPGGGTGILDKLNGLGALQQNSDGTFNLVSGAAATIGSANAAQFAKQSDIYSNIGSALTSFQKTVDSTTQFMNRYGLNQSGVPIISQLQNAAESQLPNKVAAIAAFKQDVSNLQNDYATFLTARDGSVAGTNEKAAQTINIDTLSPAQLQVVAGQMAADGKNTQAGALDQMNKATQGLQTGTPANTNPGSPTSNSGWPGWNPSQ